MKTTNINKILIILVLSVLVFSGCTNSNPDKNAEEIKTYIQCKDLKYIENQDACYANLESYVEMFLNQEIQESFDIKRCDELSQVYAQNCKDYIINSGVEGPLTREATAAFIDAVSYKDNTKCLTLLSQALIDFCKQKHIERDESSKIMEIIRDGDLSKCDELKTENMKEICKMYFIPVGMPNAEQPFKEPAESAEEISE